MNLKSFKARAYRKRAALKKFLKAWQKANPAAADKTAVKLNKEVFAETDCLACSNCCRTMTPTYTEADLKRISKHLGITRDEFYEKWLYTEKGTGDLMNTHTPCQFLDLKTNMCSIYEVRPADCAGFPHLNKKEIVDYTHVFAENLHRCPATLRWVEKMEAVAKAEEWVPVKKKK